MPTAFIKITSASLFKKVSQGVADNTGLYFVLGISALLKIFIFLTLKETAINPDGLRYITAAQQFAAGNFNAGLAVYPIPTYPLLLAIVHFVIPHWVVAARLISVTFLVLAIIPLYWLIKNSFGPVAAFWGSLALALTPVTNSWVVEVVREPVFIFFFALGVHFAQRANNSEGLKYFLSAAFFGWLAASFRIEGVIFPFFCFIYFVCLFIKEGQAKSYFLKGIAIWIAFPLFLFIILYIFLGPEAPLFFKRISQLQLILGFKDFFQLKFLDNYYKIYEYFQTIENSPPFSKWHQNLAAISRHYMPFRYLLGLLETLIKVIFPFYVIPLFFGFKDRLTRSRLFLLSLVICYLFVVYYSHVTRDFISTRFLLIPAFFLFAWIGRGMERLFTMTTNSARPGLYATVLAILILLSPVYKIVHSISRQDHVITHTGKWIAAQKTFDGARIVTNDARILFYANRDTSGGNDDKFIPYHRLGTDYARMERLAYENQTDVLVIRTSVKRKEMLLGIKYFKKVKEFIGKKKLAVIYCSADFLSRLEQKVEP